MSDAGLDLAGAPDPGPAFADALARGRPLLLPTSGSTSAPRRVVRTAESWLRSFDPVTALSGIRAGSRVWVPGPRRSTMNLFALVHAHHVGATVVGAATGASHAVLTPALLRRLLDERDVSGLTVVVAGDRLSAAEHERARAAGVGVHHYYGAAELSFVAWGPHEDALRLFPGVEAEVRDREIWVRSPYLCSGYDGPEGVLRQDARGFATVGDLGTLDDDRLVVHGRPGTVLTSGATVLTADVEAVLGPHARGRVVVVPAPHPDHGEVVAAVLDDAADHAPLVAASRSELAPAARPRVWLLSPDLPLTGGGKVDRAALAAQVAAGALRRLT